jgi:hypothetical protein
MNLLLGSILDYITWQAIAGMFADVNKARGQRTQHPGVCLQMC